MKIQLDLDLFSKLDIYSKITNAWNRISRTIYSKSYVKWLQFVRILLGSLINLTIEELCGKSSTTLENIEHPLKLTNKPDTQ